MSSFGTHSSHARADRKRKQPDTPGSEEPILSLNQNDVLLGRGQHVRNEGNIKFRTLVRARAAEYHSNRNKGGKDVIARQVIKDVMASGGRFVRRKVDPNDESAWDESIPPVYELADEATVLVKVKQTMRDYTVILKRAAAANKNGAPSTSNKAEKQGSGRVDSAGQNRSVEPTSRSNQSRASIPAVHEAPSAIPAMEDINPPVPPPQQQVVGTDVLRMLAEAQQQQAQQQQLLNGIVSMLSPQLLNSHSTAPAVAPVLPYQYSASFQPAIPNPSLSRLPAVSSSAGWSGTNVAALPQAPAVAMAMPHESRSNDSNGLSALVAHLTASRLPLPVVNVVAQPNSNDQQINALILSLLQPNGGNGTNQGAGNAQQPPYG